MKKRINKLLIKTLFYYIQTYQPQNIQANESSIVGPKSSNHISNFIPVIKKSLTNEVNSQNLSNSKKRKVSQPNQKTEIIEKNELINKLDENK